VPDRPESDRLSEEIQELFADLWQVPRFGGMRHGFRPNVDCFHTDDPHALTVVVELPGVDPASVRVGVAEHQLTIAGVRTRPHADGRVYQQMEIEYGVFERQVRLEEDVDPRGAQATYDRGILTITLPVVAKPAPSRRVAIVVELA
jgi:HSP20 family protein